MLTLFSLASQILNFMQDLTLPLILIGSINNLPNQSKIVKNKKNSCILALKREIEEKKRLLTKQMMKIY